MLDTGPGFILGHDPHCYDSPAWLASPRIDPKDPPPDIDRIGLDASGRTVWIHGPEIHRVRGRRVQVWCVRVADRRSRHNAGCCGVRVWDGGCSMAPTRADAIASFRLRTRGERIA